MLAAAEQVEQQTNSSSRLIRTAMFAVHVIRQEHGLDLFGFIIVIKKLAQASGQETDQFGDLCIGNLSEPLPHAKQFSQPLRPARIELRRRFQKKRLQIARQLLELVIHPHKCFAILRRNLAELCLCTFAVRPPGNHLPIQERDLDGRIARNHPQAELAQLQVGNHFRPQHAGNV